MLPSLLPRAIVGKASKGLSYSRCLCQLQILQSSRPLSVASNVSEFKCSPLPLPRGFHNRLLQLPLDDVGRSIHTHNPLLSKTKDRGKDKKAKKHVVLDEEEMNQVIDLTAYKEKLDHAVQDMKKVYAEQVSVRTATGSLNSIRVTLEGDTYPLNEVAQIAYKNPQLIIVNCTAFPQATPDIMKALLNSGMNLNPQQDGTTIYVPVPRITMEHREQLAKNAKILFNRCKDAIRDLRNRYVAQVKKSDKAHPADLLFSVEQQVHAMSEHYAGLAEEVLKAKQAELLNVK